eukprot:518296-Pelagomonas_calceolata.AAC.1
MDFFQRTEQPNYLAEGYVPLVNLTYNPHRIMWEHARTVCDSISHFSTQLKDLFPSPVDTIVHRFGLIWLQAPFQAMAEETFPTLIKERETHWHRRAVSPLHHKATKQGVLVGIWRDSGSTWQQNLDVESIMAMGGANVVFA